MLTLDEAFLLLCHPEGKKIPLQKVREIILNTDILYVTNQRFIEILKPFMPIGWDGWD